MSRCSSSSIRSIAVVLLALSACNPGNGTGGTGASSSDGGGPPGSGGAGAGPSNGGNGTGGSTSQFMSGPGGGSQTGCDAGMNEDQDQDGFSIAQGDCNDCDANTNPGAIEVVGDDGTGGGGGYVAVDEDCDGTADNAPEPCDSGLALDSSLPMDAARSIELCKAAAGDTDWGVVSANYVRANGTVISSSLANGIMPSFGSNVLPQGGSSLFVMSSGRARTPGQPSACGSATCTSFGPGTPPSNAYPQNAPGCPISEDINDDIGLELTLRAPTNATGYRFAFKFYSFEYPDYICDLFNDQFMALVNPAPAGALDGNISFDSNNAPVSVNVAFFTVCNGCPDGENEMVNTGSTRGVARSTTARQAAPRGCRPRPRSRAAAPSASASASGTPATRRSTRRP